MIRGAVNSRYEAVLAVKVRGPADDELLLNGVIDTGFTSSLTLPTGTIAALDLQRQSSGQAQLADGTTRSFDIYSAEVEWDGQWRPVLVSEVGNEVLIGMRLLAGHELRIAVVSEGMVEVDPIQ